MKNFMLLLLTITLHTSANAQAKYDKELADSLGADEYGMKKYVLVILRTGIKMDDPKVTEYLFKGHMDNINRLVKEKKLIVAGPLGENGNGYRGIFILDVPTVEQAKELVKTDPTVRERVLIADYYPWYGSAALPVYLETSEKISAKSP